MNLGFFPLSMFLMLLVAFLAINRFNLSIGSYVLFLAFFIALCYSYLFISEYPLDRGYIATLLYSFLSLLFVSIFAYYSQKDRLIALKRVILLNCFVLALQFFIFFILKKYIDFHYLITLMSYESRFESNALAFLNIARSTGFSVEPSNAAAVLTYLNATYLIIKKKPDRFFIFSQATTIFTLSFASIGISALIIISTLYYVYGRKTRLSVKIFSLLIIVVTTALAVAVIYWRLESAVDYDALGYRMAILKYFTNADVTSFLFGQGLLIYDLPQTFNNVTLNSSHIRDSGFLINILFSLGLFGLVLFIVFLFLCSENRLIFFVMLAVCLFKFDYMQPVFWILLYSLFYSFLSRVKFRANNNRICGNY
jgi:hypothetical protein